MALRLRRAEWDAAEVFWQQQGFESPEAISHPISMAKVHDVGAFRVFLSAQTPKKAHSPRCPTPQQEPDAHGSSSNAGASSSKTTASNGWVCLRVKQGYEQPHQPQQEQPTDSNTVTDFKTCQYICSRNESTHCFTSWRSSATV